MINSFQTLRSILLVTAGASVLAACGGGGGGGVNSTPSPTPAPSPTPSPAPTPSHVITPRSQQPVRSAQDDAEYRRNYVAFEYVNALYALDNGWTGANVLVGTLDDGAVETSELAGQISPLSRDFGTVTSNGTTTARNVIGDNQSAHGTMVAGIIAARNDGVGVQGIAPDAKIVALRIDDYNADTGESDLGRSLPQALDYAGNSGVKIVNASISKIDSSQASPAWAAAVGRYASMGGLFVNAGGNDSEANVTGHLDLNASNRDSWLFVVALADTQTSYELAYYSNQCGQAAMDRCVAAMGTNASMAIDGTLVSFSGTSAAAPQVSGLAALIIGKWPQLSGIDAGKVILNTARDIGAPGVDPVFGHGLIDVRAALAPTDPTLSNGVTQTALSGSVMVVPDAFGGASGSVTAAMRQALGEVTVLDAYGRDYTGSVAGLVAGTGRDAHWLARRLEAQAGAGSTGFAGRKMSASLGYTRYRTGPGEDQVHTRMTAGDFAWYNGTTRISASYNGRDSVQDEVMGLAPSADAATAYAPVANIALSAHRPIAGGELGVTALGGKFGEASAGGAVVSWSGRPGTVKLGLVDERGTVFGNFTGTSALRFGDGAQTLFLEASRAVATGNWRLEGYASVGTTWLRIADDMLLTHAGTVVSQRFGLSASRPAWGGRLRIGMAQPLTVISGSGTLTLGSGFDLASRSLVYTDRRIDLSGSFDPLLTFGYERAGKASSFRIGAAAQSDGRDLRVLAAWRIALP